MGAYIAETSEKTAVHRVRAVRRRLERAASVEVDLRERAAVVVVLAMHAERREVAPFLFGFQLGCPKPAHGRSGLEQLVESRAVLLLRSVEIEYGSTVHRLRVLEASEKLTMSCG
jgi:hypothetical protein